MHQQAIRTSMKKIYLLAIVASTMFIASSSAKAQYSDLEIGVQAGGYFYQGDLTKSALGTLKKPKPGFGVFIAKDLSSHITLKANADYFQLEASDMEFGSEAWKNNRNLSFKTNVFDVSVKALLNIRDNYSEEISFRPFVFVGVGASFIKVERDFANFNTTYYTNREKWVLPGLQQDIATNTPKAALNIPVGIGFKYSLNNSLSIVSEGSYRFMFTDYLDGFSKVAHSKKDHFYSVSIGFTVAIGNDGYYY